MDPMPIPGTRALKLGSALIISDLHIGVEAHLAGKGFRLPSQTRDMLDQIINAADGGIHRIIMIGDVKDTVSGSTKQEQRELPMFCNRLLDNFDRVDIVPGNHDGGISTLVPADVVIRPATGILLENTGLVHGHVWPSERTMSGKTLVLGHEHPAVLFRDGLNKTISEPCWVRGSFCMKDVNDRYSHLPETFIIIPPFNRLLGGSPINIRDGTHLSPVLNLADLDGAVLHLLDGVCLGKVSDVSLDEKNMSPRCHSKD